MRQHAMNACPLVHLCTDPLPSACAVQSRSAAPARLSSSSFSPEAGSQQGAAATTATAAAARDQGSGSFTEGITGLLTSAASAVAQQLGATRYFGNADGAAAETEDLTTAVSQPPPKPGPWQLRCAVVSNLIFHIDVMAGWTYAFQVGQLPCTVAVALLQHCGATAAGQGMHRAHACRPRGFPRLIAPSCSPLQTAGCDVTVYHHERSLGIEVRMCRLSGAALACLRTQSVACRPAASAVGWAARCCCGSICCGSGCGMGCSWLLLWRQPLTLSTLCCAGHHVSLVHRQLPQVSSLSGWQAVQSERLPKAVWSFPEALLQGHSPLTSCSLCSLPHAGQKCSLERPAMCVPGAWLGMGGLPACRLRGPLACLSNSVVAACRALRVCGTTLLSLCPHAPACYACRACCAVPHCHPAHLPRRAR